MTGYRTGDPHSGRVQFYLIRDDHGNEVGAEIDASGRVCFVEYAQTLEGVRLGRFPMKYDYTKSDAVLVGE